MKKLICDEAVIEARLKLYKIRWQYWILFIKLILFLESDNAQLSDYDLDRIWWFVNRSTRYRALKYFQTKKIINIFKDPKDERNRYISILIEYVDSISEAIVLL